MRVWVVEFLEKLHKDLGAFFVQSCSQDIKIVGVVWKAKI